MKQKFLFLASILFLVVSCNLGPKEDLEKSWTAIATIENPNKTNKFFIILDDGTKLWTAANTAENYTPKTGQRVIANYTILKEHTATDNKDNKYDIRLNNIYEVLTKDIITIDKNGQDSIGNDKIILNNMWVGSDFLNVEFQYYSYNKPHKINLIRDTEKVYKDSKDINLEFRHNANKDSEQALNNAIVSFNISSLKNENIEKGDSINFIIHLNDYIKGEKEYKLTYKFNKSIDEK